MLRKKKYFSTIRRGEISEWKKELASNRENQRKEAVKKVVAAMTVGKDVGILFTDVINCSQTNNVELKKLVYLYMMNYAPQNHDLAILAVSSLVKDISHENALIRGLALRTMSSMGIPEILEYLTEPLKASLKDDDPYVRKIASLAVSKYFLRSPSQAIELGLIEDLEKNLRDSNPMVVSNTVVALCEICQNSKSSDVTIAFSLKTLGIILIALETTTEWGQVHILDALSSYQSPNGTTTDRILEKVVPRLQHSNTAVIMSGIKVVLNLWDKRGRMYTEGQLKEKVKKPLLTMVNMTGKPELQYVVLKNVGIILKRFPRIMVNEVKLFFCVFDEPLYVKKEKLKILVQLSHPSNVDYILVELRNYVNEIDMNFVRSSIETIGKVVLKLPECIERVIPILVDIINTKVDYSVQQSIVVLREVLRKYPNRFTKVIKLVFENLDVIDDEKAKSSTIWIVGEYFHLLDNGIEVLDLFAQAFGEERESVQMELLNCCMKVFLKHPSEKSREILEQVMTIATEECSNPDLRDKSYFYYRLLQQGIAKDVLMDEDSEEEEEGEVSEAEALEKEKKTKKLQKKRDEDEKRKFLKLMVPNLTTITSVLQTDPTMFIPGFKPLRIVHPQSIKKRKKEQKVKKQTADDEEEEEEEEVETSPREEKSPIEPEPAPVKTTNLLSFGDEPLAPSPEKKQTEEVLPAEEKKKKTAPKEDGPVVIEGLLINGFVIRNRGMEDTTSGFKYRLELKNLTTDETYRGFQVKFRGNIFGLNVMDKGFWRVSLPPGDETRVFEFPLVISDETHYAESPTPDYIQIATRDHKKVVRKLNTKLDIGAFFGGKRDIGQQDLVMLWKSLGSENEDKVLLEGYENKFNEEEMKESLEKSGIHFVGFLEKGNGDKNWYYYAVLHFEKDERFIVVEIRKRKNSKIYLSSRAHPKVVLKMFEEKVRKILDL